MNKKFILKIPINIITIFQNININGYLQYIYFKLNTTILNTFNIEKSFSHLLFKEIVFNKIHKTTTTKNKSLIKKSNKKPWIQKGTGRARAGSFKSPIWRGGGIVFGPLPLINNISINNNEFIWLRQFLILNKKNNIIVFKTLFNYEYNKKLYNFLLYKGISYLNKILVIGPVKNFKFNYKKYKILTNKFTLIDICIYKYIVFFI